MLSGRRPKATFRHNFVFSRLVRCASSHRALVAEYQKGHIYYRCHSKQCSVSHKEYVIEETASTVPRRLQLLPSERKILDRHVNNKRRSAHTDVEVALLTISKQRTNIDARLGRRISCSLQRRMPRVNWSRIA